MSLDITPQRDMLLVRLDDEPTPASAIQVVHFHKQPSCHATVLRVGPEVRELGLYSGRRVLVSRLQGVEIADGLLIPESAVLALYDSEVEA
jgi:hypothetical protein